MRRPFFVVAALWLQLFVCERIMSFGSCLAHAAAADPQEELVQAVEIFMRMSETERYETIQGLMGAVGQDPVKRQEMETLLAMLPPLMENDKDAKPTNMRQLIQEDELQKAKHHAAAHVQDWESFWALQDDILQATIASGQLTPEQAATFQTDEHAWKEQLRVIYHDLHGNDEL